MPQRGKTKKASFRKWDNPIRFVFIENTFPMPNTISDKLRIKPNFKLLTVNTIPEFKKELADLPAGVKISDSSKDPIAIGYDQVHLHF